MKVKPEQLQRQLQQQTLPMYWLSGDEPLLMQECADLIRRHLREQGFSEREIFNIDRGFNWEHFNQAIGNLSLFAERKIIELRLSSNKLDDAGKRSLREALVDPSPDNVIMVSSPRLESGTLNTKWFKALEADSAVVQIWPINRDNLPTWLNQRLAQAGIQAEPEALQLLLDKIEGNLLAAVQEIEKLKLLANSNGESVRLDANTVMQVVADSSRFNAFQLVDAALLGDLARVQKILNGLQAEGTFPLIILGSIIRELRSLLPMAEQRQAGQVVNAIVQSGRVWSSRKKAVGKALHRLSPDDIWQMLSHAREIDQAIKGMSAANPWDELSRLLTTLAGVETVTRKQSPFAAAGAR